MKDKPTDQESKVVLIEGQGRALVDIVGEYISYIASGFDLTMNEIAEYLGCSYNFVQRHVQGKVRHIQINEVARMGLFEFEGDSEYRPLFTKRRLFDRNDFFRRFIPQEATISKPGERFFLEDLSPIARQKLMEKAHFSESEAVKIFQSMVKDAPKRTRGKRNPEPLGYTPKELLSLRDIVETKMFNYNMESYRYIAKNAIPKIKLYSLVRYDRQDVERQPAAILPLGVSKKSVLNWIENQLM
ncbi:hypothetical protein [Thermoactinomyces sp. CICC 10521]|uniref:hypothetical protein n=1 Tax=Thermoactinomyces sp. CICC 10521 TaxID=2767426 RepID=UPI0018DCF3E7|nr:hypothetical protein [Thermoactinomyces sp. CICC 10521]MBH8609117.1 hypothetical protein [Thermoactinomyces sp. CICC 10521]